MYSQAKNILKNNSKIFENYFFMTLLQFINAIFSILIYPYIIRKLGIEQYGNFVFSNTLAGYFSSFVAFGFALPSVKIIAQNQDNSDVKSKVASAIFTAKTWLALLSVLVFAIVVTAIAPLRANWYLNAICFLQLFTDLLFPVWLFQGLQKMRNVTMIQLSCRFLSLPFIFILIKHTFDTILYAWITTLTSLAGGIAAFVLIVSKEKIAIRFVSFRQLKMHFKEALPFFYMSIASDVKEYTGRILIGSFFSMRDLAIYDLANKVVLIPRFITNNINSAIFPQVVKKYRLDKIKKIIAYEYLLGFAIMVLVALISHPVIIMLGGKAMLDAYPVSIILSFTIVVWLVVGAYINFVFVPNKQNYHVTWNQLIALVTFLLFAVVALLINPSIINIALAMSFSGLIEIIYCRIVIKKKQLMK